MVQEQNSTSPGTPPDGPAGGTAPSVPDAEHAIPRLEFDESVPPRPEEEIADAARTPYPGPAGGPAA
jgi:hypothetical protein